MKCLYYAINSIFLLICSSGAVFGFQWPHLWKTADQSAYDLMQQKQYEKAAQQFQDKPWKASAAYRAQDYSGAVEQFKVLGTESGYYNQGNALAKIGRYDEALHAYDQSLKINPKNPDAIFNRKLVASLLKKNQQNKENKQGQDNKQEQKQKPEQKQDQVNKQDKENKSTSSQQDKNQDTKSQDSKNQQAKKQDDKNNEQNKKNAQNNNNEQKKQDHTHSEDAQKNLQNKAPMTASEREKQQEKEQWLRLVPDDPGGLLREKFLRDSVRRQRGEY